MRGRRAIESQKSERQSKVQGRLRSQGCLRQPLRATSWGWSAEKASRARARRLRTPGRIGGGGLLDELWQDLLRRRGRKRFFGRQDARGGPGNARRPCGSARRTPV